MAACKNLLCVNSFTEANQRHALAASKQIGRANDTAEGGFLSFFHLVLCVWSGGWMKATPDTVKIKDAHIKHQAVVRRHQLSLRLAPQSPAVFTLWCLTGCDLVLTLTWTTDEGRRKCLLIQVHVWKACFSNHDRSSRLVIQLHGHKVLKYWLHLDTVTFRESYEVVNV